jgi:hypothetical protein
VAPPDDRGSDLLKSIAQLAGLLVGFVALLYAAGGGVLALRLYFQDLPSLTVVGQLPREFLISIALTQLLLPALLVAAVYGAVRLLFRPTPMPRRFVAGWSLHAAGVALALLATGVGWLLARNTDGSHRLPGLPIAFALSLLVALVALKLRAEAARKYEGDWDRVRPAALMACIVGLGSIPIWVIVAGTFHLLDAKVCTTSQTLETGVLIGETGDRVYIGEERSSGPRRVASFPLAQVEEVFIGGKASSRKCGFEQKR